MATAWLVFALGTWALSGTTPASERVAELPTSGHDGGSGDTAPSLTAAPSSSA